MAHTKKKISVIGISEYLRKSINTHRSGKNDICASPLVTHPLILTIDGWSDDIALHFTDEIPGQAAVIADVTLCDENDGEGGVIRREDVAGPVLEGAAIFKPLIHHSCSFHCETFKGDISHVLHSSVQWLRLHNRL